MEEWTWRYKWIKDSGKLVEERKWRNQIKNGYFYAADYYPLHHLFHVLLTSIGIYTGWEISM